MFALFMAAPSGHSGGQDDIASNCIARIAKGDKEALAELYEKTHGAVYGFALSVVRNREDAEDVLQDVYIQIWKASGSYQPQGKPLAWIFTIAKNLARMRLREQSRTVTVSPEDWQTVFADEPSVDHEDRLLLSSLLGTLSEEERQIVMLHSMTGLKHREIAALLEMALPTVLSKYSRALKKLRNALKEAD